jgi:transposase
MILRMGIDIAVRAPHQASLADDRGELIWSGHRFRTTAADLRQLWVRLPDGATAAEVTVVMEPTRNAWVPLAAWFRRQGARVVLVSAERSADLRAYYAKHTKSDRLDSILLARLPMLHPDGLHPERGLGPGDPLRRATKLHSTLVKRRTTCLARLDALLEILGPDWHAAFGADLANKTPLRFLAAGYADPHTVKRLGRPGSPGSSTGTPAAPGTNPWLTPSWPQPGPPPTCGAMTSTSRTWPRRSRSRAGWHWP